MSETKPIVLAIGAHPDDIEFGCGGTMARLASQGATLHFAVCTDGNRGSRHHDVQKQDLIKSRKAEQQDAAKILGASQVSFLDEEDGNLLPDIHFKEKIVRLIRQTQPTMVFTHDPAWFYRLNPDGTAVVNHTDHRACGQAVLDAVYPLARDRQSFEHHLDEGLSPHTVPELFLFHAENPNFVFDITDFIQTKIDSIHAHKSQIDDPQAIAERMTKRHHELGQLHGHQSAEAFTRLVFK